MFEHTGVETVARRVGAGLEATGRPALVSLGQSSRCLLDAAAREGRKKGAKSSGARDVGPDCLPFAGLRLKPASPLWPSEFLGVSGQAGMKQSGR
jgi:hypothetical protein